MTDREHAIVRLALSNLERSIRLMPTKTIRGWKPPLTIPEVARVRRQLDSGGVALGFRITTEGEYKP